jgi:hypothetical protein
MEFREDTRRVSSLQMPGPAPPYKGTPAGAVAVGTFANSPSRFRVSVKESKAMLSNNMSIRRKRGGEQE